MSRPIAKAVNEVYVEREFEWNCVRPNQFVHTFISPMGYFVSVFETWGAGQTRLIDKA